MTEIDWLAARFEEHRGRLRAIAYRVLGSASEADDAVQEAWLRLSRADAGGVDDLGAWLTTVVGRIAIDQLRARASRREAGGVELPDRPAAGAGPEDEAVLADSVGEALLVVLDSLAPAERLAFVLHDTFGVPFEEIGAVLDRSPQAAKQLAHRARRKVQGRGAAGAPDPARQRAIVDAFLAAARQGDFAGLVRLLHPDAVLEADAAAVMIGAPAELRGAEAVAGMFSGRALGARPAQVDGLPGFAWSVDGRLRVAWAVTVRNGRIARIDMVADREGLAALDVTEIS
jgi:RNA polymerase sigma factor (sigma-70 family)